MKNWEIIADNLDSGRGKRYLVRADEKLTAFVELEAVIPSRSFSFEIARVRTETS
jgi:hypothetical protein